MPAEYEIQTPTAVGRWGSGSYANNDGWFCKHEAPTAGVLWGNGSCVDDDGCQRNHKISTPIGRWDANSTQNCKS